MDSINSVGTVLNSKGAKNAINAGAKFLMSPAMVKILWMMLKAVKLFTYWV